MASSNCVLGWPGTAGGLYASPSKRTLGNGACSCTRRDSQQPPRRRAPAAHASSFSTVPQIRRSAATHAPRRRAMQTRCQVSKEQVEQEKASAPGEGGGGGFDVQTLASSAGGLLLWAAFGVYAIFLAPNQTPYRDSYFIEKLLGQGADDGVAVNAIFTQFWNLLGVLPALLWALLVPTAKSGNKVPIWPFTTLSLGLGFLALGPYFALWTPSKRDKGPPSPADLEGWSNLSLRITESRIFAILLLVGTLVTLGNLVVAPGDQWAEYLKLFDESRLVHVSSLDLTVLTLVTPFWMYNDAAQRDWSPGQKYLPLLAALPILGPVIYLVLRPRAGSKPQG